MSRIDAAHQSRRVVIRLPLPPPELHQNFRGRDAIRRRMVATRDARWVAAAVARSGGVLPGWERCEAAD